MNDIRCIMKKNIKKNLIHVEFHLFLSQTNHNDFKVKVKVASY